MLELIRALPRDSSARLEQFQHVRRDRPAVNPAARRTHPMYLPDPIFVVHREELDSSRLVYHLRTLYNNKDTRVPIDVPLDDYRRIRMDRTIRQNWEQMAQAYEAGAEKKTGLGEVFGKVTNIEIPVPKNPLFSIFGPNIIKLQINGAVDIHAAFRNTLSSLATNSPLGQSRDEPDFNQEVQVNVRGEIGDKLKIDADWNTKRTFEYENQLHIHYTGYDDEIVQSVEAGNVSLQTNSAFISSSQALFGIKAGLQFGPLRLTTIASQKKGQIKALTVSGGSQPTPFERRPTDYSQDHYFVDTVYIGEYENNYLKIPAQPNPYLQIRDIEVWVTDNGTLNASKDKNVIAFINVSDVLSRQNDPASHDVTLFNQIPGQLEVGRFSRLDQGTDYIFNANAGIITMNRALQPDQAIAVAYSTADPTGLSKPAILIGNFGSQDTSSTLIMKLVRPRNLDPSFGVAWQLMLKNRYLLGGRGINQDGFALNIEYQISGQPPYRDVTPQNINLLQMFGLDRYIGNTSQAGQDKVFDYLKGLTIDESRGELIFPTVEPFSSKGIQELLLTKLDPVTAKAVADSFAFDALYDTTYYGALNSPKNRFYIRGTIKPATASSYNLGFNIVEGSVKVLVDGVAAAANVDYVVDYISGQVTIKNQALLVPGRNLQIQYEANDLFQIASKTLIGARADLSLSPRTNIGFTIMNLDQQSLSDKVRLGEEPISNTIMGFDGSTSFDADFITKALNWLPGIQTTATSPVQFKGEAAYMLPNPNTRVSPISEDQGKSIAYIDDFEGANKQIPLGVTFTQWKDASPPYYIQGLDPFVPDPLNLTVPTDDSLLTDGSILPDTTKMGYKALMTWFNLIPTDVIVTDIWPKREVAQEDQQVTVLNMYFKPGARGEYNYSMNLENTVLGSDHSKTWGGIQHVIGTTATNLLDENIGFIEVWVKIPMTDPGAKLNIDLGYISEDVIPNHQLDTEDGVGTGTRNGFLNPGEDVGLDGLTDDQEKAAHTDFINKYSALIPNVANDPSGDNWRVLPVPGYTPLTSDVMDQYYLGVDGTENSAGSELGARFPDTEDLNGNNALDRTNSYFEYELSLDTSSIAFQHYVTGGQNGWYQIRIPIDDFKRQIGAPSFTNIEDVRLWMTGAQSNVLVRMTELNLIGNQWQEVVQNDPEFKVSAVNVEDNPNYTPPTSGLRTLDLTRPDQNLHSNEQSLDLIVTGMKDGETKLAMRQFNVKPLDVFSYKTLKMFVHGESADNVESQSKGYRAFAYTDTSNYDVAMVFQFGYDSLNYYEYREPVHPGWDPLNEVLISFGDITAIKLTIDSAGALSRAYPVPNGPPGSTYRVRGSPTLTDIRYIAIGVDNPVNKGATVISGELWVDELRLTDVDNTPGWAYRFDTSVKLADVGSMAFSYSDRDPYFHSLEDRFGTRNTDVNWSFSGNFAFERFLPETWTGSSLAFSYSHVEAIEHPKYLPGTDILVDAAASRVATDTSLARSLGVTDANDLRLHSENLSVTETYSLPNVHLNIPSSFWWITETVDRLTFAYSYTSTSSRSPTEQFSDSWNWNSRLGYLLPLSPNNYIEPLSLLYELIPLDWWKTLRLYYTPKQISLAATLARSHSQDEARNQTSANPVVRNLASTRSMSFSWQFFDGGLLNLGTDYQLDVSSSLVNLETDQYGRQRSLLDILNDMFFKERLIDFGQDLNYGQTINLNTRIVVPKIMKLDQIFSPTLRYSSRYDWSNNLQAGNLGKAGAVGTSLTMGTDFNSKTIADLIWNPLPPVPTTGKDTSKNFAKELDQISRSLIKTPFFDFDRFNISFTQTNRSQNMGLLGGPGFANIFDRVPLVQSDRPDYGPSLYYQLGFASDPHGDLVIHSKDSFPFIAGYSLPGPRAANGTLTDVYSQSNRITMRTSRPLWEGAQIDLNWNVAWDYNANTTITTDGAGNPTIASRTVSGDVDRSFMSFPPVLIFQLFHTSLDEVDKKFEQMRADPNDTRDDATKLSQAFSEGLEAFPWLSKVLGGIAPRLNWTIRWDGLEKLSFFHNFASRVTLDHSYTSDYRDRFHFTSDGQQVTDGQTVTYGFNPLLGVTVAFKEVAKGTLGASARYGTSTTYDLTPSIGNVAGTATTDITLTADYARQGFQIPFFGLSLSNDVDMSLSYTYSKNAQRLYDLNENYTTDGIPQNGSSRTVIEPKIRYVLSARVTASLYYSYTKIAPDAGGSSTPGSTVNEGGLDVHVSIQ